MCHSSSPHSEEKHLVQSGHWEQSGHLQEQGIELDTKNYFTVPEKMEINNRILAYYVI